VDEDLRWGQVDITSGEAEKFLQARKDGDVDAMIGFLRHPVARPSAVLALGRWGAVQTIPKIIPLLHSGPVSLRRSAAHALGQLQARDAVEPLFQVAFNDDDRVVRQWALFAIGCISLSEDDTRLRKLAKDPETSVRVAAISAMLSSQNPSLIEAGAQLRGQESWRQRRSIRRVCRRIENERVAPLPD
jgi:HEAT repeat protein